MDMLPLNGMLVVVSRIAVENEKPSAWQSNVDHRVGLLAVGYQRKDGVREEIDGDEPFAPDPRVVDVRIDVRASLGTIVEIAELDGLKVLEKPMRLQTLENAERAERHAGEVFRLDRLLLEVDLDAEVLLQSAGLRRDPDVVIDSLGQLHLFGFGDKVRHKIDPIDGNGDTFVARVSVMRTLRIRFIDVHSNRLPASIAVDKDNVGCRGGDSRRLACRLANVARTNTFAGTRGGKHGL